MHEQLKEYFMNFGFSKNEIAKIFELTDIRDVNLIKAKIQDYKKLLNVSDNEIRKMIVFSPALLAHDTNSESETSVKGKIKAYKNLLNLNDSEIRKMIVTFPPLLNLDTISESETSVKGKIKAYKELLKLGDSEIRKMIVFSPILLGHDTNSASETSVKGKIKAYKNLLNLNDSEIRKMISTFPPLLDLDTISESDTSVKGKIKAYKNLLKLSDSEIRKMIVELPNLLGFDLISKSKTSIKSKTEKIQQIIPFEELRGIAIQNPIILAAPAQSFRIRYMLANVIGNVPEFFNRGFQTNERKVWARFCHLQSINNKSKSYIHLSEKHFVKWFGITSEELMEKYPLDEKSVKKVEQAYFEKTGEKMVLDAHERAQLGLDK